MKRGGPIKRKTPLKGDPQKNREWQQRSKPLPRTPLDIGSLMRSDGTLSRTAISVPRQQGLSSRIAAPGGPLDARKREPQTKPRKKAKRRRDDSAWKAEVHARYGTTCVSCGATRDVQADHMWPRSQGGPSDPRNGLPLCGQFSDTKKDCHGRKTASTMVIRHEWLQQEQIDFLAESGWVQWDEDGQPHGRGWKHFAPIVGSEN